jgi:predicted transcriptional regulator
MTRDLISVTQDTPLDHVVDLMERRRIKRVPVFDGDLLVGMLSRADLLRALAGALESEPATPHHDDEIREHILAELAKAAWVPRDGLSITVTNGVVDLNGVIVDEQEREALRVWPRMPPGSRLSRITWSGSNRSPASSSIPRRTRGPQH